MKKILLTLVLVATLSPAVALAYAPEPELMSIKGYSPELIDTTNTQRSRQEWREPEAPRRSPREKFFHNIFYNNWTGSLDDFGRTIIRNH